MKLFLHPKDCRFACASFLVVLTLVACSGETASNEKAKTPSEQTPILDQSPSLAGPDVNSNGIRDDIDAYITGLALPLAQKIAAEQLARGLEQAVEVDSSDLALTRPISEAIKNAISCVWSRFPTIITEGSVTANRLTLELQKFTANTKSRVLSYLKYNGSLNGTATSMPQGDGCVS